MSIDLKFRAWKSIAKAAPPPPPQRTGFDLLGSDKELQSHWIKRIVAIIIDSIILSIIAIILTLIILYATRPYYGTVAAWFGPFWGFDWLLWTIILGIFEILYFAFLESFYGWSFGKKFMGLKVITLDGKKPDIVKAFIRNVTKFFGLLLLIDWIAGLATVGDPHQKFTDRYAGTTVTSISPVPAAPPPPPPA